MTEAEKDIARSVAAVKAVFDGRDPHRQSSAILVTLEHAVAAALLMMFNNPSMAAGMLNEGLLQGIESRLALYASKAKEVSR